MQKKKQNFLLQTKLKLNWGGKKEPRSRLYTIKSISSPRIFIICGVFAINKEFNLQNRWQICLGRLSRPNFANSDYETIKRREICMIILKNMYFWYKKPHKSIVNKESRET